MKELVNNFSWSVSRDQLFRSCERAYYYQYYGSWGGWERNADARTRKLYLLKNLKTLPMWAGTIVHDTVAEALRRYAQQGTPVRTGELQAKARMKLRQGWSEAVNQEWRNSPKRKTNLQELYYGNGKQLPREQTERIRSLVYDCLETFCNSSLLKEILAVPYMNWKRVDELEQFNLNGTPVWCALDMAFEDPAGTLKIIDWKTGSRESDAVREQLACYAFFAQQKWQLPPENMRILGVFLKHSGEPKEYPITSADLVNAQESILSSAAAMRSKLADVESNTPLAEEEFRLCDNPAECRNCKFREICPRDQTAAEQGEGGNE